MPRAWVSRVYCTSAESSSSDIVLTYHRTGLSSFINTYGTSVSLKHIGWKTYTIFLILHFIHNGLMWLSCVETKGRTLEEIDEIFNDPKPVKRSLQKTAIIADSGVGVMVKDDA